MVAKSAADAIRTALNASHTVTAAARRRTTSSSSFPANDDKVSDFSSRGIRDAGNVKPDVTGVGQSVFSAGMGTGNDGLSDSGTSMATPDGRRARGARPLGARQLEPRRGQGRHHEHGRPGSLHGRQSHAARSTPRTGSAPAASTRKAALDNGVLAYVTDDPGAVSASFGTIEATGPMTLHKTIKIDNKSGTSETYNTSYEALTSVPGATYSVSPSQVTVGRGSSRRR